MRGRGAHTVTEVVVRGRRGVRISGSRVGIISSNTPGIAEDGRLFRSPFAKGLPHCSRNAGSLTEGGIYQGSVARPRKVVCLTSDTYC